MIALCAFVTHEFRTALRSSRFRICAFLYVAILLFGPAVLAFSHYKGVVWAGFGRLASFLALGQPLLTTLMAVIVATDGIAREHEEESFVVASMNGMSNSGYLVRRWLAIFVLLAGLSVIPPLLAVATGFVINDSFWGLDIFASYWLLHTLPLAGSITALLLALGTITSRVVSAILSGVLIFAVGLGFANDITARRGFVLNGPGDWLGLNHGTNYFPAELVMLFRGWGPNLFGSDSPFDLSLAIEYFVPRGVLMISISMLLLALASLFMRRTRRDVRPWRISDTNPIRTYLRSFNRLREEMAPEPKPTRTDWTFIAVSLAVVIAIFLFLTARADRFRQLAATRYRAEKTKQPAPTPLSLRFPEWRVEGRIGRSSLDTQLRGVVRNEGPNPVSRAALTINPTLTVGDVAIDKGSISSTQAWDRLELRFDPPLLSGESRTVSMHLTGTPSSIKFELPGASSFLYEYESLLTATEASQLTDVSRSMVLKRITRHHVALHPGDLVPLPRYTPWDLTEPKYRQGPTPIDEQYGFASLIDIDVAVPEGVSIATSCGAVSSDRRLRSRCSIDPGELQILGGALAPIPVERIGTALVHRAHIASALQCLEPYSQAAAAAQKIWPDLDLFQNLVYVEIPDHSVPIEFTFRRNSRDFFDDVAVTGGLLQGLGESVITDRDRRQFPRTQYLIGTQLFDRRPVKADEQMFFRRFYAFWAAMRMGNYRDGGALTPKNNSVARPVLGREDDYSIWNGRLQPLMVDLENRVGAEKLEQAVRTFIARQGEGSSKELFELIEEKSGVPLQRFYSDFLLGDALPRLNLVDVRFKRVGELWQIEGAIKNDGTGEVFCPVVLRTEYESLRTTIRTGDGSVTPFSFTTRFKPRLVELDPLRTCYRDTPVGTITKVEYKATGALGS